MTTVSYNQAANPIWYLTNLSGQSAGAGYIEAYSSLDKSTRKYIYQDAGGLNAYPWPVPFNLNGTRGPFYFKYDSASPSDLYYLRAYDSAGNFLWDDNNFNPASGGSGGSIVTNTTDIDQYIVNNVFQNNTGTLNTLGINTVLAPSTHTGLTEFNPTATTFGYVGPDIRFLKGLAGANDDITYEPFNGANDLSPDITPEFYVRYSSGVFAGENFKCVQFPVTQGVQNFDDTQVTFSVWIKASTTYSLEVKYLQYFGASSGASNAVLNTAGTLNVTTSWQQLSFPFNIVGTGGKILGDTNDNALYIRIYFPHDTAITSIDFIKPKLFLGSNFQATTFDTPDEINSIINTPRTGDVKLSMTNTGTYGWLPANNGTIGSSGSNATNRAKNDTWPLYSLLWNQMKTVGESYAPLINGSGAVIAYGASAIADYEANYQLSLLRTTGSVLAGTYTHTPAPQACTFNAPTAVLEVTVTNARYFTTGTPVVFTTTGTFPTLQDTRTPAVTEVMTASIVYYAVYVNLTTIKLAYTLSDAFAGNFATITVAGTGTFTVQEKVFALGYAEGEGRHGMTAEELLAHTHTYSATYPPIGYQGAGSPYGGAGNVQYNLANIVINSTGSSQRFNVMQPTLFLNVFYKL